jgi:glyoxylase-like metal-dependent hydrolase (beta-lactamase superfamily II)
MKTKLLASSFAAFAFTVYAQPPQDFSKVEIKTNKVSSNFYTLDGQGGTIGVLVGRDGIFMVDSQFAPLSEKIAAAIRQISDQPIRFLVNTHVHPDHTGGNENFAKMGATILSRDELRWRLIHPAPGANGAPGVPAPAAALPVVTYEGPVTIHMDGEEVRLIPILRAHTDGDTLVHFVSNDILMTGDFFRSIGYPNIDRVNGGTLSGILEALGITIGMAGPNTKIIPGHGPTVDRSVVVAQRDMILAVRDKVAKLVEQGKTLNEVLAAKPTSDFDATTQNASTTSARFLRGLYAELKTN